MLLALVFGFVLVLVGVTASALVAVATDHLSSSTLNGVVKRDASLVELFVNGNLRATDLDEDGPSPARAAELGGLLASLTGSDEILHIEIRGLDGRVLASDVGCRGGQGGSTVRRHGGGSRRGSARDRRRRDRRDRVGRPARLPRASSRSTSPSSSAATSRSRWSRCGATRRRCSRASTRPGATS